MPPLYRRPYCHPESKSDAFREPMVRSRASGLPRRKNPPGRTRAQLCHAITEISRKNDEPPLETSRLARFHPLWILLLSSEPLLRELPTNAPPPREGAASNGALRAPAPPPLSPLLSPLHYGLLHPAGCLTQRKPSFQTLPPSGLKGVTPQWHPIFSRLLRPNVPIAHPRPIAPPEPKLKSSSQQRTGRPGRIQ